MMAVTDYALLEGEIRVMFFQSKRRKKSTPLNKTRISAGKYAWSVKAALISSKTVNNCATCEWDL